MNTFVTESMMELLRRLHKAVKEGDKAGVERAVASGADMDIVWGMEGTALCNAISSGCLDMILLLMELGCDINAPDFDGGSPLSLAIRKHQVDACFILLSNPLCDVNQLDPVTKCSPLCLAVVENITPVVEALVQDSRCRYVEDLDPSLHLSLQYKHYAITSVLSRCDALRMLRNAAGLAPVHIVAQLGDLEAFELLYPSDCRRDEIYHQTGEHGEEHTVYGGTASASLLSKELNQRCTLTGNTALHLAVRGVHVNIVESLLRLGADANLQNNAGQTALLLACAEGHRDLALMLLQAGASPNLTGFLRVQQRTLLLSHSRESTLTPLHVAAASGDQPLVAMLCEYGADVNACDERGRSPLYLALINSSSEVALYLVKSAKSTLKTRISQMLRGNTLLHAACHCFSHTTELAEQLIELGCSVNAPNSMGNLPLHDAISLENIDMVATLLSKGASPSCRGADGCLPLRMAAMTGRIDIARLLLSAGASLEGREVSSCLKTGRSDFDFESVQFLPFVAMWFTEMGSFSQCCFRYEVKFVSVEWLVTQSLIA